MCGIRLNPGVSRLNLIAFFVSCYVMFIAVSVSVSFSTFILRDPMYYDVPDNKVASIMGQINSIADCITIPLMPFVGIAFDMLGRRVPLTIAMLVIAVGVGCFPLESEVYPWFFLFRVLLTVGFYIGMCAPLCPDYVHKNDIGKS